MNLNLIPTHPDRCASLAFLGKSAYAFGQILFAEGAMLAGVIANRILYRGDSLQSLKLQIAGIVAFFILAILGPLTMFTPRMARAKTRGWRTTANSRRATSRGLNGNGSSTISRLTKTCSELPIFSRWQISVTAMPLYARCVLFHSDSRTFPVWPLPRQFLSCLSCSRFSPRRSYLCA
jgi:hypothetical protein